MKIMINSPVNSILPFSMNYYYVILLRQKSCSRNNDDVCLSFHCCAYLSRHFPRLVGFSCILHHFKLIKTMITMITKKNNKKFFLFVFYNAFFHSCNFMQCDWRTFILWLKSQYMVKRCVLNFSCDLNYFGEFFWSAKHNTLSFHWKGKHKYYIRLLYKW